MRRKNVLKLLLAVVAAVLVICWRFWPTSETPRNQIIWSLAVARSPGGFTRNATAEFYAATTGAVYMPSSWGLSWTKKVLGRPDVRLVTLAADPDGNIAGGTAEGEVYVSGDRGDNWSSYRVSEFPVSSIVILGEGKYLAATFGDGVFELQEGSTWKRLETGDLDLNVWSLASDRTNRSLVAITPRGAYSSPNGGSYWERVSAPTTTTACAISGGGRFLARKGDSLLVSDDRGRTSSQIVFGDGRALGIWSLAADADGDVVVGTKSGAYWSNDSGHTWKPLQLGSSPIHAANVLPFEVAVSAQEFRPPVEVPRVGPAGPTMLPPLGPVGGTNPTDMRLPPEINQPLSPRSAPLQARESTSTQRATQSGSEATVGQSQTGQSSTGQSPSGAPSLGEPFPDPDNGGGPPPTRSPVQPLLGLACSQTEDGPVECEAAELKEYLKSVLDAKDIAEVVAKMVAESLVGEKSVLVVATDEAKNKVIEELMHKIVKRMMDQAVQNVHNLAQATSSPPLLAEVRAHEAYVQRIRAEAVRESIKYVNASFEAKPSNGGGTQDSSSNQSARQPERESRSQLNLNTSGPAFHQLTYSALHGAGWW